MGSKFIFKIKINSEEIKIDENTQEERKESMIYKSIMSEES